MPDDWPRGPRPLWVLFDATREFRRSRYYLDCFWLHNRPSLTGRLRRAWPAQVWPAAVQMAERWRVAYGRRWL